jgi:putative peptidoglycan lipid II flippase
VPRATSWDLASVAIGLAALVGMLLLGVRGPALVLPLVLAYGLYTVAGWPYAASGKPQRDRRRELDAFVVLGAAGTLASTGFLQLSQITAKVTAGNAEAGQYAAALNLATPASMLAASLSLVLFPSMAEAWGRGDYDAFHTQTDRATRALAVVMVGIFGCLILCSRLVVGVVWGPKFRGAEDILPILVLAVLATNLGVSSVNALTTRSQRGMWVTTGASLLGLVVGGLVWLVAAEPLGTIGVAVGYLCGTLVIAAIPVGITWHRGGHAWGGVFGRVLLGLGIVGGLVVLQRSADISPLLDPVFAAAFLAAWWGLCRHDAQLLPVRLPRRRR